MKITLTLPLSVAMLIWSGACAQQQQNPPPAPMSAPQATVSLTHFAGSPLSGPRPAAGAVAATPAVRVDVEWLAVERMPERAEGGKADAGLTPLGSAARLVLATRDRQPVLSSIRLTAGARWATGDAAAAFVAVMGSGRYGQSASMLKQQTALPPEVTLDVRAVPGDAAEGVSADTQVPVVEVFLQHVPAVGGGGGGAVKPGAAATAPSRGALELALAVQDYAAPIEEQQEPAMNAPAEPKNTIDRRQARPPEPPAAAPKPIPQNVLTREIAVLPPLKLAGGEQLIVLVMPSNFVGSPAQALVAVVRVAPASDDPATQKQIAAAIADVRRQGDAATGHGGTAATSQPAVWPGYESALATLDRADARRRALVYLAGQTNAKLCGDVALVADDATVQQLAADARASAAAAKPPYTPEALGWLLDRASLAWCARLSGENRLPPELAAVLSTYAGEAGRRPASLEEMLRAANSRASLDARLVSENLIYLEDSSPSARVRANGWLAARGRAPAGYDPLGPPRQRREALERALEAAASQPPAPQPAPRPTTQPSASSVLR